MHTVWLGRCECDGGCRASRPAGDDIERSNARPLYNSREVLERRSKREVHDAAIGETTASPVNPDDGTALGKPFIVGSRLRMVERQLGVGEERMLQMDKRRPGAHDRECEPVPLAANRVLDIPVHVHDSCASL